MTWEVRAQRSKIENWGAGDELGWSAVFVDTKEEAEAWFECRTRGVSRAPSVHTLFDPQGEVVKVAFGS